VSAVHRSAGRAQRSGGANRGLAASCICAPAQQAAQRSKQRSKQRSAAQHRAQQGAAPLHTMADFFMETFDPTTHHVNAAAVRQRLEAGKRDDGGRFRITPGSSLLHEKARALV
jgi:hypothetical protein